jgi:hypothetical protein
VWTITASQAIEANISPCVRNDGTAARSVVRWAATGSTSMTATSRADNEPSKAVT